MDTSQLNLGILLDVYFHCREVPGTYSLLAAGGPAQQVSDEWQLAGSAALKINFR